MPKSFIMVIATIVILTAVHLAFGQTITGVPIISAFVKSTAGLAAMNIIGGLGQ